MGVTTISANTFEACSNLETITFKGNLTSLDFEAFKGCTKLSQISFEKNTFFGGQPVLSNSLFDGVLRTDGFVIIPPNTEDDYNI